MPRVTVIIPTFNRAALVVEAIGSVLRQSYRDFEVVVCDDGSSDGTAARVRALEGPVRYLGLPHAGRPGSVRNRGIEAASGELVAFLDDDDLWEPDKLARQVELFEREPELSLVYTDRRLLYSDGSVSAPVPSWTPKRPDKLFDLALRGRFPCLCTVMLRTDLLRRVGGFDEALVTGEDLDLWLRLGRFARAARVPEPLVVVRRREGSLSDRSGPLAFENAILLLERSLAADKLRFWQRLRCRGTLAHLHAQLAAALTKSGDLANSSRAARRAIGYSPAQRAAWVTWAGTLHARLRKT